MKSSIGYCLGSVSALVLSASVSLAIHFRPMDPLADVKVTGSYRAPDFGSIELEGVCRVTPEAVSCWDGQGKADAALTDSLKDYLTTDPNCVLYVGYGQKDRIAVFRRQGVRVTDPDSGFATLGTPRTSGGRSLGPVSMTGGGGQGGYGQQPYPEDPTPQDLRYEIETAPGAKTETVLFPLNVMIGRARLPLQTGAKSQIGPIEVRVTGIRKATPADLRLRQTPLRQKSAWIVSIQTSGYPGAQAPLLRGYPLSAKGEEIRMVEASGNPVPPHSILGTYFEGPKPTPTFFAGLESVRGSKPGAQEVWLFADPAKVSALSLTAGGTRTVAITDIPLDPVEGQ